MLDDSVLRRNDALQEMMRFARSILLDGTVTDLEVKTFRVWIERNPHVMGIPAVEELVGILRNVFDDGRLTESERAQLARLLEEFTG